MEEEGSGAWFPNMINAIIVYYISGIFLYIDMFMTLIGSPGFGYEFVVGLDMFPAKVESHLLQYN